ncbi:MAG TPA: hypothetical protein VJS92_15470, partial [Candidatus Polarisedimenticolaceae bacterium]|nr:hypothetical protein [Candidatus Polarisedimenticolaceae bacterium]
MADRVSKVSYAYVLVPHRAGQGTRLLAALRKAHVNLLAYSGFPAEGGQAQLDFVTDDMAGLKRLARKQGWTLRGPKRGFLVAGKDRVGAVHRQLQRLADAGVNVTAAAAVCAGKGRYGMILWVPPASYSRA